MADDGSKAGLTGGGNYPGAFRGMVVRHLDRTSALELSPGTDTEQVLHNSVLWLYDHTRPILEANPDWAQRWNDVTPTREELPTAPADADLDVPEKGGNEARTRGPGRQVAVNQAVRRRQRRVLIGCLMDVGVLRTRSVDEAHLDGFAGTLWDLDDDAEPTPGVRESDPPDPDDLPDDHDALPDVLGFEGQERVGALDTHDPGDILTDDEDNDPS